MTKEEIARAKELDLLTYFKLVEPGNLKLVGKEYRHKVHSSLTISKDSLWCWHCIGLRGRTALKYLIDVEKVPYVEAVREINRIQGGVVHSSPPVSLPQPRAEPEAPRDFKLPDGYQSMLRSIRDSKVNCVYVSRMRQISGKERYLYAFSKHAMKHYVKVRTLEYSLPDRLQQYRLGKGIEAYARRTGAPLPW